MRIGLAGYGAWGHMHAGAIGRIEGLSLGAVLCGSDQSAALATQELPSVTIYRDFAAMLADPTIDLVDVVVPNHLHASMAVAAVEAGKHVLLEKPMATTLADAERVPLILRPPHEVRRVVLTQEGPATRRLVHRQLHDAKPCLAPYSVHVDRAREVDRFVGHDTRCPQTGMRRSRIHGRRSHSMPRRVGL